MSAATRSHARPFGVCLVLGSTRPCNKLCARFCSLSGAKAKTNGKTAIGLHRTGSLLSPAVSCENIAPFKPCGDLHARSFRPSHEPTS